MRHFLLENLRYYILESSRLMTALEVAVASEFEGWQIKAEEEENDPTIFLDWFIFDYPLKKEKTTPFELFLKRETQHLSPELKTSLEKFRDSIFSLFSVKAIRIGKEMILKEFFTEKEYQIKDDYFTKNLRKGESFFGRIFPIENHFILGFAIAPLPETGYKILQLRKKYARISHERPLLPSKEALQIILGLSEKNEWSKLSPKELKNIFLEKTRSYGLKEEEANEILARIDQNKDLENTLNHILNKVIFKNKEDLLKLFDFLKVYINALIRESKQQTFLGLKEKTVSHGSIETVLIEQLLDFLKTKINPADHPNPIERDALIQKIQKNWFHNPQKELDGKTPHQAITEERKRLGNFNPISYSASITSVPSPIPQEEADGAEKLFKQALKAGELGHYKDAMELYEKYLNHYGDHFQVWGNLGAFHLQALNIEKARKCFLRSLALKPDYLFAKKNLDVLERTSKKQLKKMIANNRLKTITLT